jgi:hypothetical protein
MRFSLVHWQFSRWLTKSGVCAQVSTSFDSVHIESLKLVGLERYRDVTLTIRVFHFGMLLVSPIIPHPSDKVMNSAPVVPATSFQIFLSKVPRYVEPL